MAEPAPSLAFAASAEAAAASRGSPYDGQSSVGAQLRRIVTQLVCTIDARVGPLGLTDAQWRPLLHLLQSAPATTTELARRCVLDTAGLTRLVDRLVLKGLCQRERSQTDRRVVYVSLTEEGQAVARQLPDILALVQQDLLRGLDAQQLAQLRALLSQLERNVAAPDDPKI